MKCSKIMEWLEARCPARCAEDWDNVGLLVGREDKEVSTVFLALDLTEETLQEALLAKADLIVTHHPLIFGGIRQINSRSSAGRRILTLIREDIACFAMHTNYDVMGMAELSAKRLCLQKTRVLHVTEENGGRSEGFGRVGTLPREMTLEECARFVKEAFGLPEVKVFGERTGLVRRAAVCTGSGKSMVPDARSAGADVYITGDMDHHTGIDAAADGLFVIDAGHYGTEYIFMDAVKTELAQEFPKLTVLTAAVKFPYWTA